jgi:hypothetical protein
VAHATPLEIPYLFSWDDVPGNDNERFVEFLKQKYSIDWVTTAKIEKIDDGKAIIVSSEKNSLSLRLNDEKTKVNLKIDDGRLDELSAKTENSKLNIYEIPYIVIDDFEDTSKWEVKTRPNTKLVINSTSEVARENRSLKLEYYGPTTQGSGAGIRLGKDNFSDWKDFRAISLWIYSYPHNIW